MRSTNSTAKAPTLCSKFWKSRRGALLLLLVSHSAARVLPTIRSRCRLLALAAALGRRGGAQAAAAAIGEDAEDADIKAAAAAADGSVRRALALLDGEALDLRNRIIALLERLPAQSIRARCMRSATASTAAIRRRLPPSSTP